VSFVDSQLADHHPVAVHCERTGRTGTMLSAGLISQGESPALAICRVRESESSAVETPGQIRFLEQFALPVALKPESGANGGSATSPQGCVAVAIAFI
jgi:protein-tyrosine phosphatase